MEDWSLTEVRFLKGVGPKLAEKLEKLGIHTQRDLLFHLPLRYEDRSTISPIGSLHSGQRVLIEAEVLQSGIQFRRSGRSRRTLFVKVADGTGFLTLRMFFFSARQQEMLEKGSHIRCFGEVRNAKGELEMVHPEFEVINQNNPPPLPDRMTPVYPTTEGLHQQGIKKIISQVIDKLDEKPLSETLPAEWISQHGLPDFSSAMMVLHRPLDRESGDSILAGDHIAQRRFIVEELTAHRLALLARRAQLKERDCPAIKNSVRLQEEFLKGLGFQLTGAQQRVIEELFADFQQKKPMSRLLQGDVGSGKTVVAALTCLPVVESGYQCALMAPTEILADQHFVNLSQWLEPLNIQVVLLKGADKGKKRTAKLEVIENGVAQVIVGTHALFQESVCFRNLGFIVIDEQHRFGVDQRLALQRKASENIQPHQLVMTATPIPRTLAMSIYADLDYSQIDELPPGRTPVATSIVGDSQRDRLIERVARSCAKGGQVYWVCTLIEESEQLQCEAAEITFEHLKLTLPDLQIGLVHGRMKSGEKEPVVSAFKSGDIDLLVATTVIEVGVDVPNANIMIIENPERLGLSQIHQLRGRVGRGKRASFCILLVKDVISNLARQRLDIIRNHNDGFVIAERDLQIRGAGEVLGTKQTGEASFRIADLLRDQKWFKDVNHLAELMLTPKFEPYRKELIQNWVGQKQLYSDVG
jgi:ATP-dependent DNA helicase RecG